MQQITTMQNKPQKLRRTDWFQILGLHEIWDMWGLHQDTTIKEFASMVYAVRFDFQSGSPGYCGDLYILQGDVLTGDPPIVITRDAKGSLVIQDFACSSCRSEVPNSGSRI